jgi:hypothetical protein
VAGEVTVLVHVGPAPTAASGGPSGSTTSPPETIPSGSTPPGSSGGPTPTTTTTVPAPQPTATTLPPAPAQSAGPPPRLGPPVGNLAFTGLEVPLLLLLTISLMVLGALSAVLSHWIGQPAAFNPEES